MAYNDHSDTLSEPPLSPFSSRSLLSDGTQTSDEPADLGAFTSVFRVMNQMQALQEPATRHASPESRGIISMSENESDSSRWSHQIIDAYLQPEQERVAAAGRNSPRIPITPPDDDSEAGDADENKHEDDSDSSDTEGTLENRLDDGVVVDGAPPSLGVFDSTLGYLASEFAKLAAADQNNTTARDLDEPRKRRRRKRRGPSKAASVLDHDEAPSVTVVPTPEASSSSSANESSSPYKPGLSFPDNESALSRPRGITHRRHSPHRSRSRPPPLSLASSSSHHQDLYISSSLPNFSRPLPSTSTTTSTSTLTSVDSRLQRLRLLKQKLLHYFTQNSASLNQILIDDLPENSWIDPRGPEVQPGDPLIHVFIDHSNILVGFLNQMKRPRKGAKPHLYFPALLLILERGRAVSRRVVAASSPLYQSMDPARELGYSVHIYARVPDIPTDLPNGIDNTGLVSPNDSTGSSLALGLKNVRPKKLPQSTISASSPLIPATVFSSQSIPDSHERERERGGGGGGRGAQGHSRSSSHPTSIHTHSHGFASIQPSLAGPVSAGTSPSVLPPPARIRYREQGVDELLQLKFHQALLSPEADPLPPGSTIVLATGDGASGQFNEEGFLGAVKTALAKGWNVELYAWGRGISNAWWKVAEELGGGKLKIWALDQYAGDLLEIVSSAGAS